jgi:hypothetical protein
MTMNMVSAWGFFAFIQEDFHKETPLFFARKPPFLGPVDQSWIIGWYSSPK